MNKKILIALLSLAMLTAAKCNDGIPQKISFTHPDPECGEITSFTVSYLRYGTGKMVIVPISEVRPGAVFIVGLDPRKKFKNATVTVKGMGDADWIDGSGTFNGLPKDPIYGKVGFLEAGCAPSLPEGVESEDYKYMIEIHDTATGVKNILDPLVRVEK